MSTHKFRAWDPKNKKFAFVGFHFMGEVSLFNLISQYNFEEQLSLEITQYSLVNDTNGVEVYEGDRITVQDDYGLGFGPPQGRTWSGIIELDAGRFTLNMGNSRLDWWMDAPEIYVIGNKYE